MRKLSILIVASLFLLSCGEDEESKLDNAQISFQFKHFYKTQELEIRADNNLIYTNSANNPWNVKVLKYYISKLSLVNQDGTVYDVNMYKYINPAELEASYTQYLLKDIPNGRYTKLSFIFGIDSARNKPFVLENTSENNSMEWPSQIGGGYHFMMMDGVFRNSNNQLSGYGIHLGKPGNQIKYEFPIDFTAVEGKKSSINIKMSIDQWFDGLNKIDLNDGYGYIMEDDAKQLLFKQNGESSVFDIEQL
jgi:hypothetical protein